MKTLLAVLLFPLTLLAQNVAVLTHGAANTPDFREGCPTNWPYRIVKLGKSTELPEKLREGWVVMTEAELEAAMKRLEAVKEAWNNRESAAAKQAEETKQTEINSAVADIESLLKTWESADEKSRGEVLHKMLYIILEALKSLGAPVNQIEKPVAK